MESKRKVTAYQGKDFATINGMKFFEISARESTNVSEEFIIMTRDLIELAEKKIIKGKSKTNIFQIKVLF